MYSLRTIVYGTPEYEASLALRDEIMRKPMGLCIYDEDFSWEKYALVLGLFQGNDLIGTCTMSSKGDEYKLEYICVDPAHQRQGLGMQMLRQLEETARSQGGKKILMDARVTAQPFYEAAGYHILGDIYYLSYAPVPHYHMEKDL